MSTKIYNGFIIDDVTTFAELKTWIENARETLEPVKKKVTTDFKLRIAAQMHTAAFFADSRETFKNGLALETDPEFLAVEAADKKRDTRHVIRHYISHLTKSEELSYFKSMVEFSLQLFFTDDNRLMGYRLGNAQPEPVENWLKALPGYRYYGYWNNVDPDENCTEEEWEKRKKDWDFLGYAPIGEYGLNFKPTMSFTDYLSVANAADIVADYWKEHRSHFVKRSVRAKLTSREFRKRFTEEAKAEAKEGNYRPLRELEEGIANELRKSKEPSPLRLEFEELVQHALDEIPDMTEEWFESKLSDMFPKVSGE